MKINRRQLKYLVAEAIEIVNPMNDDRYMYPTDEDDEGTPAWYVGIVNAIDRLYSNDAELMKHLSKGPGEPSKQIKESKMKITRRQLKRLIAEAINEGSGRGTVTIKVGGKDHAVTYQMKDGKVIVQRTVERGSSKPKVLSWYSVNRKEIMDGLRQKGVKPLDGEAYEFPYDYDDKPIFFGGEN